MPDIALTLEQGFRQIKANADMIEHIRVVSAATDALRAEKTRLEGHVADLRTEIAGLSRRLTEAEAALARGRKEQR